eukprot:NODE_475_length_868_cov_66.986569_g419_i0.p2 GENE.NODE_475_length_868_cov_66.986569_g419_i0~~NODE_475_length_868_cov_66.986569_g419_i0.p2  ORF type:complete len:144 (-),score=44.90 NODE_475_length_868_cov_66.986569_g419_i0:369-800(-)
MSSKCKGCGKTVYPTEKITAVDADWHKGCLKCATCSMTLNLRNLESYNKTPYCRAHMVAAKTGGGTQSAAGGGDGEVVSANSGPAEAPVQEYVPPADDGGYDQGGGYEEGGYEEGGYAEGGYEEGGYEEGGGEYGGEDYGEYQ